MNQSKYLYILIGVMFSLLMAIGTWWVNRVEKSMEVTAQLQFRSVYLNGNFTAAPVTAPASSKP